MARTAMRANDAFLLGFREHVHDAFVALRPVTLGKAMHQADIDVVSAEFLAKAIEVGTHGCGITCP